MPGKVKYDQLTDFEKKKYLGDFYTMVASLKNRDEVKMFFKDILTLSEVVMISRRLQIAQMLLESESYEDIKKKLRTSFDTIGQVDRWLNTGFGGYRKVLERNKRKLNSKTNLSNARTPFSLDHIRRKYPLHFLLLNLLKK
jgi:TrpR-related protein YerC/YecD